eukprot:jgi/Mesvir1/21756/Mv04161-RA.1
MSFRWAIDASASRVNARERGPDGGEEASELYSSCVMPGCKNLATFAPLRSEATANEMETQRTSRIRRRGCVELVTATCRRPTLVQLSQRPIALLTLVPESLALFISGAIAGGLAKTLTAPFDRIKILLQVKSLNIGNAVGRSASGGFMKAFMTIAQEEGIMGYWKGNLPQVVRTIPYAAAQLYSYEYFKRAFKGDAEDISVPKRLAAGACAGMVSTLLTYPLDTMRLRMAVEPTSRTMSQVAMAILREEGARSFYKGLGPTLISIAPYLALNFAAYDLLKKSLPPEWRDHPAASMCTGFTAAFLATTLCYPMDTIRRQMQMRGSPYTSIMHTIQGTVEKHGWAGLYSGFVPNAVKNFPNNGESRTYLCG